MRTPPAGSAPSGRSVSGPAGGAAVAGSPPARRISSIAAAPPIPNPMAPPSAAASSTPSFHGRPLRRFTMAVCAASWGASSRMPSTAALPSTFAPTFKTFFSSAAVTCPVTMASISESPMRRARPAPIRPITIVDAATRALVVGSPSSIAPAIKPSPADGARRASHGAARATAGTTPKARIGAAAAPPASIGPSDSVPMRAAADGFAASAFRTPIAPSACSISARSRFICGDRDCSSNSRSRRARSSARSAPTLPPVSQLASSAVPCTIRAGMAVASCAMSSKREPTPPAAASAGTQSGTGSRGSSRKRRTKSGLRVSRSRCATRSMVCGEASLPDEIRRCSMARRMSSPSTTRPRTSSPARQRP